MRGKFKTLFLGLNEVVEEIDILLNFGRQPGEHHENLTPYPTHNLANDNTGHISRPWPA